MFLNIFKKKSKTNFKINIFNGSVIIDKQLILSDINIKIEQGKTYRISGHNGSGKTVLIYSILGLIQTNADIKIISYDRRDLCYIPAKIYFFDTELVEQTIKLIMKLYAVSLNECIYHLEYLGLLYEDIKTKKIIELSQGMQQKLLILPLFFSSLSFYILDEIFVHLDGEAQEKIIQRLVELTNKNKTILIIEHNESTIEKLTNRIDMEVIECKDGKVIQK